MFTFSKAEGEKLLDKEKIIASMEEERKSYLSEVREKFIDNYTWAAIVLHKINVRV